MAFESDSGSSETERGGAEEYESDRPGTKKNSKLPYQVVPLPEGSNPATQLVTDQLVVLANSKRRDAILRFIQFAYEAQWRKRWAKLGVVPELRAALVDPEFRENALWSPFLTSLPQARWIPMVPWEG